VTARSLQFSANLSFLFTDSPFDERFARAARAGFRGVEYMFPYAFDAQELSRLLREYRLQQVLHNLPAGDWDAGERGIACLPGREDEFRAGVEQGIAYARELGCPHRSTAWPAYRRTMRRRRQSRRPSPAICATRPGAWPPTAFAC